MSRLQQTLATALAHAIAHHRAGRLEEAEAIYRQVLAQAPRHFDAIHLLGLIAHQRGDHATALREITRALAINDRSADAHSNLGLVHRAMGDTSAALACQLRAVKLHPNQFQAHLQLGDLLAEHGKLDQAIACHRRAVELNPASAAAHNNLGNSLRSRGLLEESANSYRRAIEIDPSFAAGFTNLGMVLCELQQYANLRELPAEFSSIPASDQVPVRIINSGIPPRPWNDSLGEPLVSCIMLTSNRPAMARRSIECFLWQTYPNKELLILSDREQTELAAHIASLNAPNIRFIHQAQTNKTLGERRNDAIALAHGEWICTWDDDDLYDAARLSVQMSALRRSGAVACFLDRLILWWPVQKRLAVSERRNWEGSLVALKSALPPFAHLARAEDTPVMRRLLASARVANIDVPRLYTYVLHGGNTTPQAQFEYRWSNATDRFVGGAYQLVLHELHRGLGLSIEDTLEQSSSGVLA